VTEPRAISSDVRGLDELERGSRTLFRHIDDGADRAFLSTADQVATLVGRRQPVLTGRLAASAGAEPAEHGASVTLGGSDVPYAGWIEFGGTRGRPYVPMGRTLYPAAEESKNLFEQTGDKLARQEIGGMLWPKPSPSKL
jgi:hypothetical protein